MVQTGTDTAIGKNSQSGRDGRILHEAMTFLHVYLDDGKWGDQIVNSIIFLFSNSTFKQNLDPLFLR